MFHKTTLWKLVKTILGDGGDGDYPIKSLFGAILARAIRYVLERVWNDEVTIA